MRIFQSLSGVRWRNVFGFGCFLATLGLSAAYLVTPTAVVTETDKIVSVADSSDVDIVAKSHGASYENTSINDMEVLRAVLENYCSANGVDPEFILSSKPANSFRDVTDYEGEFAEAKLHMNLRDTNFDRGPEESLLDARTIGAEIPDKLACNGIRVLSEAAIEDLFEGGRAAALKKNKLDSSFFNLDSAGVKAVIRISFPGYSRNGSHAMVYTSTYCGRICGSGQTIQLRKTAGAWKVIKRRSISIA